MDPVTATVLAVKASPESGQDGGKLIWVSCDLVCIPDALLERVRACVTKRLSGVAPRNIILNATHTHTAPQVRLDGEIGSPVAASIPFPLSVMKADDYLNFITERIAEAAQLAWERRELSGIGYGLGHVVVGYNRRVCYLNGECRMYGNTNDPAFSHIEGHEDHSVNVLAVWNRLGHLTGVVVNLACPPRMTEHIFDISVDYWHETRLELRRRLGGGGCMCWRNAALPATSRRVC